MNNELSSNFADNNGLDFPNVNFSLDAFFLEVVQTEVGNEETSFLLFFIIVKLEDGTTDIDNFPIDKLLNDGLLVGNVKQVNFIFHIMMKIIL
jgi:hypothetical protein